MILQPAEEEVKILIRSEVLPYIREVERALCNNNGILLI